MERVSAINNWIQLSTNNNGSEMIIELNEQQERKRNKSIKCDTKRKRTSGVDTQDAEKCINMHIFKSRKIEDDEGVCLQIDWLKWRRENSTEWW